MKSSFTISGMLLFLAGAFIFMGIITGEIYHPEGFSTKKSYISELGASILPGQSAPQPSATIFNLTMIITGIMVITASFFIQKSFRKLITTIPLGLFGTGIFGVGIFPGDVVPWHGIFALIIFIIGGIAAITCFKIVASPLKYVFIILGITALFFLVSAKVFIPILGVGGTERWIFYPLVFWITGLGGYLLGLNHESKPILPLQQE